MEVLLNQAPNHHQKFKMHCQRFFSIFFCLWTLLQCCVAVRWADFEDFLMNHNPDQPDLPISTTPPPSEDYYVSAESREGFQSSGDEYNGSGDERLGDFPEFLTTTLAPTTLPRSRMTCCELGKLAGQNNFHCNPNNYGPQMLDRDQNRGYGNFKRNQPSNRHTFTQVKQFKKCISREVRQLAMEFQVCCKQAYREQLHQTRENEMIIEVPVVVNANNKPSRTIFQTHNQEQTANRPHKVPAILGLELADEETETHERHESHDNRRTPYNRQDNRRW